MREFGAFAFTTNACRVSVIVACARYYFRSKASRMFMLFRPFIYFTPLLRLFCYRLLHTHTTHSARVRDRARTISSILPPSPPQKTLPSPNDDITAHNFGKMWKPFVCFANCNLSFLREINDMHFDGSNSQELDTLLRYPCTFLLPFAYEVFVFFTSICSSNQPARHFAAFPPNTQFRTATRDIPFGLCSVHTSRSKSFLPLHCINVGIIKCSSILHGTRTRSQSFPCIFLHRLCICIEQNPWPGFDRIFLIFSIRACICAYLSFGNVCFVEVFFTPLCCVLLFHVFRVILPFLLILPLGASHRFARNIRSSLCIRSKFAILPQHT